MRELKQEKVVSAFSSLFLPLKGCLCQVTVVMCLSTLSITFHQCGQCALVIVSQSQSQSSSPPSSSASIPKEGALPTGKEAVVWELQPLLHSPSPSPSLSHKNRQHTNKCTRCYTTLTVGSAPIRSRNGLSSPVHAPSTVVHRAHSRRG